MFNKRYVRLSVGVLILIVLVFATLPYFYKHHSNDGIVNARTTTLSSPIEGVLHFNAPTRSGRFFKQGEVIGVILNDRVEESFLYELITERKTLEARIASLTTRLANFNELRDSLKVSLDKYQKFSYNQVSAQIEQQQQRLLQEREENERAGKEYESSQALREKQIVNQRTYEQHRANYQRSGMRLIEIENRIKELKNSLEAVAAGTFLGEGHSDSPYSKQRMDQMLIEIELAQTARNEAENRIIGIDKQIERERERIAKAKRHEIISPFDALVWRMVPTEGSTLVIDSEIIVLLDCESIFLDVIVSESQFANIVPGEQVSYRMIGENRSYSGEVFAKRGSGSVTADVNLAAEVRKDPRKDFHLWVRINPADLDLNPHNFFQVGRRVEVRMPKRWNFLRTLVRFWNVF